MRMCSKPQVVVAQKNPHSRRAPFPSPTVDLVPPPHAEGALHHEVSAQQNQLQLEGTEIASPKLTCARSACASHGKRSRTPASSTPSPRTSQPRLRQVFLLPPPPRDPGEQAKNKHLLPTSHIARVKLLLPRARTLLPSRTLRPSLKCAGACTRLLVGQPVQRPPRPPLFPPARSSRDPAPLYFKLKHPFCPAPTASAASLHHHFHRLTHSLLPSSHSPLAEA